MRLDNLLLERDGAVAVLPINRPRVLGTLTTQTINLLRDATVRVAILGALIRVLRALTGVGGKGR